MKIKCVYCGKSHYIRKGFRNTQRRGKIQKYQCQNCNKYFTNDEGFYGMKNNEKKITMAIDMYLSNLSSRKMRNQLMRHFEYKISHVSILDWVRRYVKKVQKFVNKTQPQLSGRIYADETEIDRRKKKDVFWCAIDWDTRFITSYLYSPKSQNMNDAIEFMKGIKKNVNRPKYIQTDALGMYPRAVKKVFYSRYKNEKVKHIVNNVSKTKKHNVRIETVFSKIKDRVEDFRGLKALWSAPLLLAGIVLQHNFIENHTTTGVRPCELAELKFNTGANRWLGLIKIASIS